MAAANDRERRPAVGLAPAPEGGSGPTPADLGIGRLFRAIPDAVVVSDAATGRVVLWNPGAERLFGWPATEAVGRLLADLVPGASPPAVPAAAIADAANRGPSPWPGPASEPEPAPAPPVELATRRRDGTPLVVEISRSPIADAVPDATFDLAFVRDVTGRKRVEAELASERDLLQTVIDTLPDAVYLKDAASRFLRVNRATAQFLGLADPAAAVGKTDADFFPAALARQYLADEQRVVATGEPVLNKLEPQSEDEEGGVWWLTSTVPLHDAGGQISGLLGIGRDVTERNRAEGERLRRERAEAARLAAEEGQRRLAFLAEATARLAASLDHEANLERLAELAVPEFADWFAVVATAPDGTTQPLVVAHADGFDPDLADGPGDDGGGASTDLLAHAVRTGVAELIPDLAGAAVADPVAVAHAWPLLRLGLGSALAVPLTVRGRVLGAMGFARSAGHPAFALEDRALAEDLARRTALAIENARLYEEARASEARFRTLVDATVAGVVLADAEGGLAYANDAYLRIVGYDRADFDAGRVRWTDLTPPEWAEADRRSIAEARRDGVSAPFEKEYRRKDGERVPVLVAVARTEEAGREQLIGFVLDIGERKRLERLRQDFLAMVTHDLRTPLTTVRASAQMLQRWAEYRAPTVEAILEQTGRMQRLLDDLADVVRLEEGRLEPRRGEVDLVDLARRQTEALAGQAAGRRLLVVAPPGPVVGPWDGDRLVQVLQNLLANALKYAPDGGDVVVTVEADAARGEARLAVRDGGPGIPPEHQARLFERFYRAGATGAGGLGLGLYIARMIVEAHGGRIAVASAPGVGSTFTVTLPLPS